MIASATPHVRIGQGLGGELRSEAQTAPLDDMLCFSLYAANRATARTYRRLLEPWDLTYPQYLVLVLLWRHGTSTVSNLGVSLGLDSGTLSPLLGRLEAAELVTRTRDAEDGRIVTVSLSKRGAALREELAEIPARLAACIQLDLDAARALLDTLHDLTEGLHQHAESDGGH